MARNDPKHGRWILPLIIAAMVVLTVTFVNGLDPADSPEGTTTVPEPPFPTTPTSSTTTLPPSLSAFMVTMDVFQTQAQGFRDEVTRINDDWEARRTTFNDTRAELVSLQQTLELWDDEVANINDVPGELAEGHVELVIETSDLAPAVEDIVLGLEAPDDGTLRRDAVNDYYAEVDDVLDAIQFIRDTAAGPTVPTTTIPDTGETTTSTTEGDNA